MSQWGILKNNATKEGSRPSTMMHKPIKCQDCGKRTTTKPYFDFDRQTRCAKCWTIVKNKEADELAKKLNRKW